MDSITPQMTYMALLIVQALHLLHHRISKRHISFVEVITAGVLCISPSIAIQGAVLMIVHVGLIIIQIVGSVFIKRLSPDWSKPD